jgi:hypothetical protein
MNSKRRKRERAAKLLRRAKRFKKEVAVKRQHCAQDPESPQPTTAIQPNS